MPLAALSFSHRRFRGRLLVIASDVNGSFYPIRKVAFDVIVYVSACFIWWVMRIDDCGQSLAVKSEIIKWISSF